MTARAIGDQIVSGRLDQQIEQSTIQKYHLDAVHRFDRKTDTDNIDFGSKTRNEISGSKIEVPYGS